MKRIIRFTQVVFQLLTIGIFLSPLSIKAQNCGCVPLLYEGFDYPEGETMNQKVGGTGWGGAWEQQSQTDTRIGFRVGTNTLSYSDLRSNYKSFVGGHYWHLVGRPLDINATGALSAYRKDDGMIGKTGTTLWTSAVFQKTQNNDEETWFGLHNNGISWYHGGNGSGVLKLLFGYFGATNSNVNGVRYWTVRVNDSYYRTNVPIQTVTPIFPVMKLDFSANSTTINLYLNPPNLGSGAPPSVPTWSFTTAAPLEFRNFVTYGDYNINNYILDEIRFASNFACVAPDVTQAENQLPIARMSISPTTGVAPLTVNVNGSTSSDPDGTLSNYEWTFGDGGTRTGATASYTFNNTGVLYARLKVTDNCGSTNSVTQNVLVTDASGHISCLSAPVPEAFPNCAGTGGGVIRVNPGLGSNFDLVDQNGTSYPYNNSRFSNLPIGNYNLTVTGSSGCADVFALKMPADSMNCPNVAANGNTLTFGMNIEGLAYWDKGRPFKDFMKSTDNQLLTTSVTWPRAWDSGVAGEIPTDTEGYPTVLPAMTSKGLQTVHFMISAGGHLPLGNYVFLYDGEGQFYFRGTFTMLPGATAGRVPLSVDGIDNLYIEIEQTTQGNHLRNFRLVRAEDETSYVSQPFQQAFLDKLCPFNPIRFMDWQVTNASTVVNWSDRSKSNDRSQTMRNGVSYEHIIQLANILNRDIWICVPHQANDDYIHSMARLFRDGLNPNIRVFLEYSNEVWNFQFSQADWVIQHGNQNINYPRQYAERSLNTFRIWHQEWAGQTARVHRVLGTQTGFNYITEEILAHAKGEFDYLAPTFYFGYGGACLNNLRVLGAAATPTDVINCTRESMRAFFPNISQTYRLAQMYGKPIAHYEGGQHMTSNPTIEPFQAALYQSQIDPQIRTLYQEMIDSMRRYGGTAYACAYTLTGPRESRYGSWGHLEDSYQNTALQPAPKYQVLLDNFRGGQGVCNQTVLPVELSDFTINCTNKAQVKLKWTTANESNIHSFEIQNSLDGKLWTTAETVLSKGNSTTPQYYSVILKENTLENKTIYYHLKINSIDGSAEFSKKLALQCSDTEGGKIKVYPNPVSNVLTVENGEGKTFEVINSLGQIVLSGVFQSSQLDTQSLSSGVYFLKIKKEQSFEMVRFFKN